MKTFFLATTLAVRLFLSQEDSATYVPSADPSIVTQPDGTSIETKANGTVLVKYKDGSSKQIDPDGTTIVNNPYGSSVKTTPDGTQYSTNPMGSTVQKNPDGSTNVKYYDGSSMTTYPK